MKSVNINKKCLYTYLKKYNNEGRIYVQQKRGIHFLYTIKINQYMRQRLSKIELNFILLTYIIYILLIFNNN